MVQFSRQGSRLSKAFSTAASSVVWPWDSSNTKVTSIGSEDAPQPGQTMECIAFARCKNRPQRHHDSSFFKQGVLIVSEHRFCQSNGVTEYTTGDGFDNENVPKG